MTGEPDRLGPAGDAVYAALMAAHDGLDADQSQALNARLVLMLANRVGDAGAVIALIDQARALCDTGKD